MNPPVDAFRTLVDAWSAAVLIFDRERRVTYSNAAAHTLFEIDIDQLTPAQRAGRLTLRDSAGRLVSSAASPSGRALRGEPVTGAEHELVLASGRRRPVVIDAYPLRDAEGNVVAAACVLVEKSAAQQATPYRLFEGVATWIERAAPAFVTETGRALAATLDYEATLDTLVHAVVPRLADWSVIRVVDEDGHVRRLKAAYAAPELADVAGQLDEYYAMRTEREAHAASSGLGVVLSTGEPVLVPHVDDAWLRRTANDELHLSLLRRLGAVSLMHVPLLAHQRTVGVITFVRTAGGEPYEMRHLAIAEELCDRAAVALENARLYRASERRRHEAQALTEIARLLAEVMDPRALAQRIADSVRLLLEDTAAAAVYSFESPADEARAVAVSAETGAQFPWTRVLPPGVGVVARAVAERRTVVVPDVLAYPDAGYPDDVRARLEASEFRALMAIPLVAHDHVLGALGVGARTGRRFDAREIALLSAFADHAAVSFHNARVFTAAEQANRSKDDFLAILSHELRTPLTAILGWVRLLLRGLLSEPKATEALEAIDRNTRLQARLINDLLDVSRIVTGKLDVEHQPVHLAALVYEVLGTARQDAHARALLAEPAIDPDAGPVIGDRVRLQQIVTNLVSNAVKYTRRGGRVDVTLRRAGEHVELVVADSGEGIAAADLPLIFERFHQVDASTTRRHGGLGLGLTIVRHLVELHRGSVHVESPGRGQGTTFTVRLPRAPGLRTLGSPRRVAAPEPDAEPLRGVRALFVDDNEDARVFVQAALEAAGAHVLVAESADDALRLFDAGAFDVVLSDIGLPGADGYDLVRRLRARPRGAGVPAIALTAYAGSDDERRALAAGFQRHVAKPIDPADLVSIVRSVIGAAAA